MPAGAPRTHRLARRVRVGIALALTAVVLTACISAATHPSEEGMASSDEVTQYSTDSTDPAEDASDPSEDKVLYLTFDDGPENDSTPRILDVLQENDARATFFTTGRKLAESPQLAQRELSEGHVITSHTWNHTNLTNLDSHELADQLDRSVDALRDAGSDSTCLRPPYGAVDDTVTDALDKRDMRSVLWNVDPQDWGRPGADVIASRLVDNAYPGAVVLLHDGGGNRSQTVAALRTALPKLRDQGYEFRPVPDC